MKICALEILTNNNFIIVLLSFISEKHVKAEQRSRNILLVSDFLRSAKVCELCLIIANLVTEIEGLYIFHYQRYVKSKNISYFCSTLNV